MFAQMPVLIDEPREGVAVAQLLDAPQHQAIGSSIEQAMRILKRTLEREIKKNKISSISSWQDAKLSQKSFQVQPAILRRSRRYPVGKKVNLPVRYVELVDQRDQLFLMLPEFSEILFVPEKKLFSTMLSETVRSQTSTLSPQEIQRIWPVRSQLRWVRLRLAQPPSAESIGLPKVLTSVAEPLDLRRSVTLVEGSRDHVVESLTQSLIRPASCLVTGESGVGKTTMIVAAARNIRDIQRGKKPNPVSGIVEDKKQRRKHPQFWLSSAGRLIAGMRYLGQWQQRLEELIAQLADLQGVLIIENLLDLVSVGGSEPRDSMGAFLIPYLRSGSLVMISEATPAELDACRRLLPELVDLIPRVDVKPMEPEHEVQLIRTRLENGLQSTDIKFDAALPDTLSRLCRQFQRQQVAPGPSMRFVEELLGKRRKQAIEQHWDANWLLSFFSTRTGLPLDLIDDSFPLSRSEVSQVLAHEVIGQDTACKRVASVVTRIKAAVQDPKRPFGCLLLCGPTGVGKTQMAKSLANYLFGSSAEVLDKGTPMTRLDMSEYSGLNAGFRFLNAADGNPANWIQQIRSRPLSVLLLDEIEKASPEVFDVLLSVLDEGRLTDRFGKVTSFQNSVILMTSNIGAQRSTAAGFGGEKSVDYLSEVRHAFKPEFFNRLDDVIAFSPLTSQAIREITEKELRELSGREGLFRYGRKLTWSEDLVTFLARVGFQSDLGARPLQQAIESQVVAPLSTWIVKNDPPEGIGLQLDWEAEAKILRVTET
ncbi:MAG: AAA family ATPase [Planctomycetota bacterium]